MSKRARNDFEDDLDQHESRKKTWKAVRPEFKSTSSLRNKSKDKRKFTLGQRKLQQDIIFSDIPYEKLPPHKKLLLRIRGQKEEVPKVKEAIDKPSTLSGLTSAAETILSVLDNEIDIEMDDQIFAEPVIPHRAFIISTDVSNAIPTPLKSKLSSQSNTLDSSKIDISNTPVKEHLFGTKFTSTGKKMNPNEFKTDNNLFKIGKIDDVQSSKIDENINTNLFKFGSIDNVQAKNDNKNLFTFGNTKSVSLNELSNAPLKKDVISNFNVIEKKLDQEGSLINNGNRLGNIEQKSSLSSFSFKNTKDQQESVIKADNILVGNSDGKSFSFGTSKHGDFSFESRNTTNFKSSVESFNAPNSSPETVIKSTLKSKEMPTSDILVVDLFEKLKDFVSDGSFGIFIEPECDINIDNNIMTNILNDYRDKAGK